MQKAGYLTFSDGTTYVGQWVGQPRKVVGELVFSTNMLGYPEMVTDPSFAGQILVCTMPHVGNYGMDASVYQSTRPWIAGLILQAEIPTSADRSFFEYLAQWDIPVLTGMDTRALVLKMRQEGVGLVHLGLAAVPALAEEQAQYRQQMQHVWQDVTTVKPYQVGAGPKRIVVIDFGCKKNIIQAFVDRNCVVSVLPCGASVEQIWAEQPDALVFSNGPGDPRVANELWLPYRVFLGQLPILGICLGFQILGLMLGFSLQKLKFGHRGSNHPVYDLMLQKGILTSQNHGYGLVGEPADGVQVTHQHWHDQSIAGIVHTGYSAIGVQFHPEAGPGPLEGAYILDTFLALVPNKEQVVVCL